jgi:hypothetical protein
MQPKRVMNLLIVEAKVSKGTMDNTLDAFGGTGDGQRKANDDKGIDAEAQVVTGRVCGP